MIKKMENIKILIGQQSGLRKTRQTKDYLIALSQKAINYPNYLTKIIKILITERNFKVKIGDYVTEKR